MKEFSNAIVYKLEQNYRSTKSIVEASDAVINQGELLIHFNMDLPPMIYLLYWTCVNTFVFFFISIYYKLDFIMRCSSSNQLFHSLRISFFSR